MRDSWPTGIFPASIKISGSLGYIDFKPIIIKKLEYWNNWKCIQKREPKFFHKKNYYGHFYDVDFPFLGEKALNIITFGIEPQGCTRLRNSKYADVNVNEKGLILGALLNQLDSIAKERQISLITVEKASIYNFYPGDGVFNSLGRMSREIPAFSTHTLEAIYNSSDSNIKFHKFTNKKGEDLEKVKANLRDFLSLYSILSHPKNWLSTCPFSNH